LSKKKKKIKKTPRLKDYKVKTTTKVHKDKKKVIYRKKKHKSDDLD